MEVLIKISLEGDSFNLVLSILQLQSNIKYKDLNMEYKTFEGRKYFLLVCNATWYDTETGKSAVSRYLGEYDE